MEERNGLSRERSGVWRFLTDGDFEEEDVWAVLNERGASDPVLLVGQSKRPPVSVRRHLPSAARMIPRTTSLTTSASFDSGSSSSTSTDEANLIKQQSAPVNIPDWSTISVNKSNKGFANNGTSNNGYVDCEEVEHHDDDDDDDDDDDEGEYQSKVPPHEILARRLARNRISSCSVFEGVGRKLKGRDLSKVRNAVLTKTGFLE